MFVLLRKHYELTRHADDKDITAVEMNHDSIIHSMIRESNRHHYLSFIPSWANVILSM
jgi:hypothetical protein